MFKFLCLLLVYAQLLLASDATTLSIHDLEAQAKSLQGQQVLIRGFLYSGNQKIILASEPNLKSCCVGAENKRSMQLVVLGDIASIPKTAVTLEGTLSSDGLNYRLENAVIVKDGFSVKPVLLSASVLFGLFFLFYRRKRL